MRRRVALGLWAVDSQPCVPAVKSSSSTPTDTSVNSSSNPPNLIHHPHPHTLLSPLHDLLLIGSGQ